jgi:hypothetical protein
VLKRDLRRALGASNWDGVSWHDKHERDYTRRELELFTETSYSKPVDFHSFRRSFVSALADTGINVQVAMKLAGHTTASAHKRYVMSRVRQVPDAALPRLRGARLRQRACLNEEGDPKVASSSSTIVAGWTGLDRNWTESSSAGRSQVTATERVVNPRPPA